MALRKYEYLSAATNSIVFSDPLSIKNTLEYRAAHTTATIDSKKVDIRDVRVNETRKGLLQVNGCDDKCAAITGITSINTTLKGPLGQSQESIQLIRDHAANLLTLAERMSQGRMPSPDQNDLVIDVGTAT